jgi:hypothetical protein
MTDPELMTSNRNPMRQVVVAWVVAVWAVAIGIFLLALHDPNTDDRMVPRAFGPPAASAEQSDDGVFVRNRIDWVPVQSGSSTPPDTPPKHR